MQVEALARIDVGPPRLFGERLPRVTKARLPAHANAGLAEVYVLGVIFAVDLRRQQSHDVHSREAAVACDLLNVRPLQRIGRQQTDEFRNRVSHAVELRLAPDMRRRAAGILQILLPVHHLQNGIRLGAVGVPHVDGEDDRAPSREVVKHGLDGRIREDAAVPVEFAIDPHRRKCGRQGAGRHNVTDVDRLVAAVEIPHLRRADIGGADRQPRPRAPQSLEVYEFFERATQRHGRIIAGGFRREANVLAEKSERVRFEEALHAEIDGRPVWQKVAESRCGGECQIEGG